MNEKRENVGKVAYDLMMKADEKITPIDQMRENLKNFEENIYEAYRRGKKDFSGQFYVVVLTKKERLMQNVLRNYFAVRSSCPTPEYDQTVYRYDPGDDAIKFMWTIPAKDICAYLMQNALTIAPEEKDLLQFVYDFNNGTLLKVAKRLNGEVEDSPLLEKDK